MGINEQRIKEYLKKLDPKTLGLENIRSIKIKKIGMGESNLNYLAVLNDEKFVVRISMDPNSPNKSKKEYDSLKIVEHLGFAPKAFHLETSKQYLGETFLIQEFIEGETLETSKEIDDDTIRKLAILVAHLHSTDVSDIEEHLKKMGSSKTEILKEIRRRIVYIEAKRRIYFEEREEFDNILSKSYRKLQQLKFPEKSYYVLGHGDIDPQNVKVYKGKLKLIDWEDLELIDPALEIVIIFDSFDFSDRQKELFLREYLRVRKDPEMRERIPIFWPLQLFGGILLGGYACICDRRRGNA